MPDQDEIAEFLEPSDVPATRPGTPAGEPAWRSGVRNSKFGQIAVLAVTAFAVIIAVWWVIKPKNAAEEQAETAAVTQVNIDGAQAAPVVGDLAPTFIATDLEGNQVDLQAMRGKPVWVMFIASWCTGCRTEMPDVQKAVAVHGDDIQLVSVYVGESPQTVKSYSDRVGNKFTQVADGSESIAAAYGVMGVPSHFFIDAGGMVHETRVGLLSPSAMDASINDVVGG